MYNDSSFVKAAEGFWLEAAGWSQFTNFIHQAGYFFGSPHPGIQRQSSLQEHGSWCGAGMRPPPSGAVEDWYFCCCKHIWVKHHRAEVPPRVFQNLWLQFELLILYTISCPCWNTIAQPVSVLVQSAFSVNQFYVTCQPFQPCLKHLSFLATLDCGSREL